MRKNSYGKLCHKNLINALEKLPSPLLDKKHNISIYLTDGRARSNESRIEHIVNRRHNLKVNDIKAIPLGIQTYFDYRKDRVYKNTYNYYIKRSGKKRGYIKVSIRLNDRDLTKGWIKTIYITYNIK